MKFSNGAYLMLLCFAFLEGSELETHYFPQPCTYGAVNHIFLESVYSGTGSSGIVVLKSFNQNYNCGIILHPFGLSSIIISVEELLLQSTNEVINITDDHTTAIINGYTYITRQAAYTSKKPGANVKVSFNAGGSTGSAGFKLVYTAYINGSVCKYSSLYQCDNDRCIAEDFFCDGYNHCGDSSNLDYCGPTVGALIGYIFSGLFLVAICMCVVMSVVRKRRRRDDTGTTAVIHPPPRNYVPSDTVNPAINPSNPSGYQQYPYGMYPDAPPPYSAAILEKENPMYH